MQISIPTLRWPLALFVVTVAAASLAAETAKNTVTAPAVDKPLVAHWTFDELFGTECLDASGTGHDASPRLPQTSAVERTDGLFGAAVQLSGRHKLHVPRMPAFDRMERIAFSAWVAPAGFERYNEIFRKEDGDRRVLFSFQNNGSILSLGLNVGGYAECDAKIDPARVLDGLWHHCAATFDGKVMRVYLDGDEIGSLERTGRITAGGPAPGCIGSSNGGECFQGAIDDLRIYADALTADQVALLYRQGLDAIVNSSKEIAADLDAFYHQGDSFAETLVESRRNVIEKDIGFDRKLAAIVGARLKARFPDECDRFAELAGVSPVAYLVDRSGRFHVEQLGRLVEMMIEYRPLTEQQKAKLTPAEARRWEEAEAVVARFAKLESAGSRSQFDPEWVELLFEAGRRIDFRPHVSEAVAPYVTPATPETRDLTAEEVRQALQRDWLHQAGGNPSPERIRDEIRWTRELIKRIRRVRETHHNLQETVRFTHPTELDALEKQARSISKPDAELYFRVRRLKRAIMLANPVVDFDKVLMVDMPYPQGKEWRHETRHRLGYMAVPGGRLLVLEGLGPSGSLGQLMPKPPLSGSFWRPDVSFDARKVLVSFKPHNEKSFHLYEIDVDGTGLVQLTDGPYDDLDPIYLPDGRHILFSTTRGHTYVRCMPPTSAYVLARCDADGKNIYLTSRNNEPDYLPSVAGDGRILYTRWEYTDKPLWRAQGLWTVNPDGTQVNTLWGNQSVWPDLLKDARSIPGSRRVMFTGSAHHNWFAGSVGIIDPDQGFNFPDGLTKVTADVEWPESGNGPVDPIESPRYHASGKYEAYYSPYPLSEQDFLVSASRDGKFVLYLMDVDGNRELIYEGVHNIFHAMPLVARPRPRVIADRVTWPDERDRLRPQQGVIYSSNVYHGAPDELGGMVRYLRVLNIEHKTYTYWHKRPYLSTGPVVSIVQSEGVKRVLGTVPVERDGSVAFHAPAGKALHFQLLDENYRALQTMRSFTGVMPGERRGCLGCHELHSTAPQTDVKAIALAKAPQAITPPPWGEDTVSYPRYVRPVLDRYCGECHQGGAEGCEALDLTPRPGFLGFDEAYATLTGKPTWGKPYEQPENVPPGWGIAGMLMVEAYDKRDPAAYRTPRPLTGLSYRSRLVELASSGEHYDVRVDPVSLRRLIVWVDTMCPYRGDEEIRQIPDPEFQGVKWLSVRPKIQNAPTIVRPGPVD